MALTSGPRTCGLGLGLGLEGPGLGLESCTDILFGITLELKARQLVLKQSQKL